jgi:excisionase family DNA binding protein
MAPAVYTAEQAADLLGLSSWAVYEAVRKQEAPVGTMAIRCGRRVIFPRAALNRLLGIEDGETAPAEVS